MADNDSEFVFGSIVGAHNVDTILINLIKQWQVNYLHEIARLAGEQVDELRPFRSFRISTDLEKMPEDQTPTLIVASPGLRDSPMKQGTARPGRAYYATYRYQFGCLLSARGKKVNAAPRALTLARMYCTAVRTLLIQKRDTTGLLGMFDWVDEGFEGLESDADRTICLAHTDFDIDVPNAAIWATGPVTPEEIDPTPQERPEWPVAQSADVDVHKEGLE